MTAPTEFSGPGKRPGPYEDGPPVTVPMTRAEQIAAVRVRAIKDALSEWVWKDADAPRLGAGAQWQIARFLAAQEGERDGTEVADAVVVPRRLLRGLLDETDYEKSNALHGEAQALLADPAGALAKHDAEVLRAAALQVPLRFDWTTAEVMAFIRERADRIEAQP